MGHPNCGWLNFDCYTLGMGPPRTLPLFDGGAQPSSWNERMTAGEYAVHCSSFAPDESPSCTVLGSLAEAEDFAREQVALRPEIRCRIYDHHGFIGAPIREISGRDYKGESFISARFRRWVGSVLFLGGAGLLAVDWMQDFRLNWPSLIGARMLLPGLVLVMTEIVIVLNARNKSRHDGLRKTT
jgi:hypothetical protein